MNWSRGCVLNAGDSFDLEEELDAWEPFEPEDFDGLEALWEKRRQEWQEEQDNIQQQRLCARMLERQRSLTFHRFLELPTEVRIMIYQFALIPQGQLILFDRVYKRLNVPQEQPTYSLALLRTSQQVHREAASVLYKSLKYHLRSPISGGPHWSGSYTDSRNRPLRAPSRNFANLASWLWSIGARNRAYMQAVHVHVCDMGAFHALDTLDKEPEAERRLRPHTLGSREESVLDLAFRALRTIAGLKGLTLTCRTAYWIVDCYRLFGEPGRGWWRNLVELDNVASIRVEFVEEGSVHAWVQDAIHERIAHRRASAAFGEIEESEAS